MFDWTIGRVHHAAIALSLVLGGCAGGAETEALSAPHAALAEDGASSAAKAADESRTWPADCHEKFRFVANERGAPATIPAQYEGYREFYIDVPWAGRSVQAVALRPIVDNEQVVHHFTLLDDRSAHLAHWAPGSVPNDLPSDVGMYLPGQGRFKLEIHYYHRQSSVPTTDQSGFEVCVTRTPRRHTAGMFPFMGDATAPAARVTTTARTCAVTADTTVRVLAHGPHMHKLGTHAKLEILRARGGLEVVHDDAFSFEAQEDYPVDLTLHTGDRVRTTCVFDNRTTRNVGFGLGSDDEMCFNFVTYYPRCALHCASDDPILDGLMRVQEGDCAKPMAAAPSAPTTPGAL